MSTLPLRDLLEACLLCARSPLRVQELQALLPPEQKASTVEIKQQLTKIQHDWAEKGLELREVAQGWRFQSRPVVQQCLDRLHEEKPPKYSRAILETLAIIAWNQPVTRADMEDIRGVALSPHILKTLEERGWIRILGHRDSPGRPALWGTTSQFLSDLGLKSLAELPDLQIVLSDVSQQAVTHHLRKASDAQRQAWEALSSVAKPSSPDS